MAPDATRHSADGLDELLDQMDAQMCLLGRLFSARHGMDADLDAGMLSMPKYLLLHILSKAGSMKMADAAAAMGTKPPALSALVDASEEAGLVAREHDPADRRVTRIAITERGVTALHESEMHRRDHMRRYLSVLSAGDPTELIRIQQVLIDAMVAERI
jgi:DNA-binding MarR family transcriptional regulator